MITLREFTVDDAPHIVNYLNDSEVTQYITATIAHPYTSSDAQSWIEFSDNNPLIRAIECNGAFVGCISATAGRFEYSHSAELGYWLGREYWEQGIGTQAVQLFIDYLKSVTSLSRVYVSVVTRNTRSIRVC
ncbi:GNAT family N-acetyltransferase [Psychrobium sp. nBUS_13]|uniref:GNAT family N-acetyltransferase n=1 Tax=Psychrobium sp. nBUS_13 TaxID=3395319 RepID=UPI003EBB6E52